MADIIPQFFITQQALGVMNFSTDQYKCILCSGSYNESVIKDLRYYYELSGSELETTSAGYTSGGIEVTGTSAYVDDTNNMCVYLADDIIISAVSGDIGPARYAVIYDYDVLGVIVYVFDFSEDRTILNGSNLQIRMDSNGFMKAFQCTS